MSSSHYLDCRFPALLNKAEEEQLRQRLQRGDESVRMVLVGAFIKLPVLVAKRYANPEHVDECVGVGNLALIDAAHKFNPNSPARFATFAWTRITGVVKAELDPYNRMSVALPVYYRTFLRRVGSASAELAQRLKREATLDELADALYLPAAELEAMLTLRLSSRQAEPIGEEDGEDGPVLVETLLSNDQDPEGKLAQTERDRAAWAALEPLPQVYREALERRFGLHDAGPGEVYKRVAAALGVSTSKAHSLVMQGLEQLRALDPLEVP